VYLLTLLLVSIGNGFNVVVAWRQQRVEVAALSGEDADSPVQYDDGPDDGFSTLVPHHAAHPFVDLGGVEM